MLTRRLARLLHLAYVPWGPIFDPGDGRGAFLVALSRALGPQLPRGTFVLRFDLPWEKAGVPPAHPGLRKCVDDIQPPATVVVDLRLSEGEILAAMKPKTRYNVKLATRHGVQVRQGTVADLPAWYRLYEETSRRDGIAIHARRYYESLFETARSRGSRGPAVLLLLASAADGELLAGNIVIIWQKTAVYLTGASSGERRNLMPTYALQWEAMRKAKAAGCLTYDLCGVPPAADRGHPMSGLYQFKTGFSPRVLERWGTWDAPRLPVAHRAYAIAERARMYWFRTARKRLAGRGAAGRAAGAAS